MSMFCGAHRVPRGGVDPIVDAAGALAVIRLAVSSPPTDETIVVILSPDHRGRTIVVVDGTSDDDAVVEVVERLAESVAQSVATGPSDAGPADAGDGDGDGDGGSSPGALIVASVRVGRGPDAADADRWLEACDVADDAGVELLEWFVLEALAGKDRDTFTAWCPRDLLAEPPRWRQP